MTNILVQYFIENDHLDLPGIGTLKWIKEEASWRDGILHAPKEQIVLDPIDNKPSKFFYVYLADELSVSTEQAIIQFDQYLNHFIEQSVGQLSLGNLGILKKNANQFQWISNYDASIFYQDLIIDSSNNTTIPYWEIDEPKQDKWWIWALIFMAISIGLILYKFS